MIAGIRNSRAEKHIFRHNDPEDLARLLARAAPERPKLVCFESVYSMNGDIAPINELCDNQVAELSSTTAISVLSCSRATRDRLRSSFG